MANDDKYCSVINRNGGSCEFTNDNLFNIPPIYVINLDRSTTRWQNVKTQLDNASINYQRFSAIDGFKIKFENIDTGQKFYGLDLYNKSHFLEIGNKYLITCNSDDSKSISFKYREDFSYWKNGTQTAGEFGCFCSHLTIWNEMLEKNIPQAIIFEDDIKVISKNLKQDLNNFINILPQSWEFALIDYITPLSNKIQKKEHETVEALSIKSEYKTCWAGTWAYMINLKGVKEILSQPIFYKGVDEFLCSLTSFSDVLDKSYFFNDNIIGHDHNIKVSEIDVMGRGDILK